MKKMLAVLVASMTLMVGLANASGGTTTGKSYKISFGYAAKIGSTELAAGTYIVAVDTASVKMTEVKTGKTVEVAAKIESSEKKFDHTAITTQKTGETIEIREIRLGGSTIQINFR